MQPEMAIKIFDGCPDMTMGFKSLFYSTLLAWQKSLAINTQVVQLDKRTTSPSNSSIEAEKQESGETPKSKKQSAFLLPNVLKNAGHAGKYIVNFYDKHQKFDEQTRKDMTDIIVRYAFDNGIDTSPASSLSMIKQIIKAFPTETEV